MKRFNTALPYIYYINTEEHAVIDGSKILSITKIDDSYTYFEVKCEKEIFKEGQIIIVKYDEKDYICCCQNYADSDGDNTQVKAIPIFFNESIVTTYKTNINDLNNALKNKLDELSNLIGTNIESQVVSDE